MFRETEHGTAGMDNLIRDMQRQMLNGEYSNLAFQEMRTILDEMQDKYSNMSEDDKLLEEARIVLVETCIPIHGEMKYIEKLDGTERVSYILKALSADAEMIDAFFNELADAVGSQVYEIIRFDNEDYNNPKFDEQCTLNELLGIRKVPYKTSSNLEHKVNSEVLESILEDITGACVGINSIQRYNLFDAITKHIDKIRKENNPA